MARGGSELRKGQPRTWSQVFRRAGASARHGAHQKPQMLISTTFPRRDAASRLVPSVSGDSARGLPRSAAATTFDVPGLGRAVDDARGSAGRCARPVAGGERAHAQKKEDGQGAGAAAGTHPMSGLIVPAGPAPAPVAGPAALVGRGSLRPGGGAAVTLAGDADLAAALRARDQCVRLGADRRGGTSGPRTQRRAHDAEVGPPAHRVTATDFALAGTDSALRVNSLRSLNEGPPTWTAAPPMGPIAARCRVATGVRRALIQNGSVRFHRRRPG